MKLPGYLVNHSDDDGIVIDLKSQGRQYADILSAEGATPEFLESIHLVDLGDGASTITKSSPPAFSLSSHREVALLAKVRWLIEHQEQFILDRYKMISETVKNARSEEAYAADRPAAQTGEKIRNAAARNAADQQDKALARAQKVATKVSEAMMKNPRLSRNGAVKLVAKNEKCSPRTVFRHLERVKNH